MAATAGREVVIAKGRGSTVWDVNGKSYLDSTASLWYMNVGYGRDEIADAVGAQLKELRRLPHLRPVRQPADPELADKVADMSAMEDAAVFFTSGGGSDAVDTAAKLARRYWDAIGRPEKQIIISREHGYHGVNAFGTSLAGHPGQPHGLRRPDPAHREHPVGRRRLRSRRCSSTTPTTSPRSSASP